MQEQHKASGGSRVGWVIFLAILGLGSVGVAAESYAAGARWLLALSCIGIGGVLTRLRWGPRS
jgi:tellurite resistance protein TehA-like permease